MHLIQNLKRRHIINATQFDISRLSHNNLHWPLTHRIEIYPSRTTLKKRARVQEVWLASHRSVACNTSQWMFYSRRGQLRPTPLCALTTPDLSFSAPLGTDTPNTNYEIWTKLFNFAHETGCGWCGFLIQAAGASPDEKWNADGTSIPYQVEKNESVNTVFKRLPPSIV